jgi:putative peptidoglycan lipid II flippase
MLLKNLNAQSKTITGAAIIIGSASLISRIIGLVRDRMLAHNFGAGSVMDSYYAAFKIPDLIYNLLILGALTAGFIPTFTKLLQKTNKNVAWKMANNVFNIAGIALIVFCGAGMLFAPWLVPVIAPGFTEVKRALTADFARVMFLSPLFLGLSMTLGGILQSLRRFVFYSLAPIFYNVGIIIGVLFLVPILGNIGLAWGVVFGAFLHFLIQMIAAIHAGYRWQWIFDLKDKSVQTVGKLMIPRTMGLAVTQLNLVIMTILASWLPSGSIAIYNYAFNIQSVPIGIIGIPFALAVFPLLSELAILKDKKQFIQNLSATIRKILFLITPITIIILLERAQIVRVILGSGEFDWTATTATANALAFFSFGLFAQTLIPLLARAFYALSDTKTPFFAGVIAELISIILALLLMKPWGIIGLVAAISLGAIFNLIILFIALRQKIGGLEADKIIDAIYRISVAGLVMAISIQFVKMLWGNNFNLDYFWKVFGQGLIAGIVGLTIYGLACYFLRLPEFMNFKDSFEKKWLKSRNVPNEELLNIKE